MFVRKHCFLLIMGVNQDTLFTALMGDLSFSCAACVTGVIVSRLSPCFPVARAFLVLVSYIALCLAFAGLKNAKTITPVMQAKGNPSEKMANCFRERKCILF